MKKGVILVLLAAAAGMLWAVLGCSSPEESYELLTIDWQASMETAEARAQETGRPMAALFYVDWGEASETFRNETMTAPAVKRFAADFVWVEVDGQERKGVAREFEVKSYPTLIVVGKNGEEIGRLDRYKEAEETARFLEECLEKAGD